MGILGIGVDLVYLPRITSLISRRGTPRLASRILSSHELLDWNSSCLASQDRFLAVRCVLTPHRVFHALLTESPRLYRWAVKEAAYKALYPVVRPKWKELTYCGLRDSMKPTVEYYPVEL